MTTTERGAARRRLRALFDESLRRDRPRSLRHRILHRVVIWILRGPVRVKVPARGMDPTGQRSLDELTPEWRDTHRRLREWIEASTPAELAAACFMHPVAGPCRPASRVALLYLPCFVQITIVPQVLPSPAKRSGVPLILR